MFGLSRQRSGPGGLMPEDLVTGICSQTELKTREPRKSWTEIAGARGVTRQSAWERSRELDKTYERRLWTCCIPPGIWPRALVVGFEDDEDQEDDEERLVVELCVVLGSQVPRP